MAVAENLRVAQVETDLQEGNMPIADIAILRRRLAALDGKTTREKLMEIKRLAAPLNAEEADIMKREATALRILGETSPQDGLKRLEQVSGALVFLKKSAIQALSHG